MPCYKQYNHQKYIESHRKINRDSIFKKHQWVVHKDKPNPSPRLVIETYLGGGKYPQQLELFPSTIGVCYSLDYKLWEPSLEDWVIYYEPHWEGFSVAKYNTIKFPEHYIIEPYNNTYLPTKFNKGQ